MVRSPKAEALIRSGSIPATPRPRPSGGDYLRNARECPHREPITAEEREGCGCGHRCGADPTRSARPNGGVTVLECWACDLAPRLSWPT